MNCNFCRKIIKQDDRFWFFVNSKNETKYFCSNKHKRKKLNYANLYDFFERKLAILTNENENNGNKKLSLIEWQEWLTDVNYFLKIDIFNLVEALKEWQFSKTNALNKKEFFIKELRIFIKAIKTKWDFLIKLKICCIEINKIIENLEKIRNDYENKKEFDYLNFVKILKSIEKKARNYSQIFSNEYKNEFIDYDFYNDIEQIEIEIESLMSTNPKNIFYEIRSLIHNFYKNLWFMKNRNNDIIEKLRK